MFTCLFLGDASEEKSQRGGRVDGRIYDAFACGPVVFFVGALLGDVDLMELLVVRSLSDVLFFPAIDARGAFDMGWGAYD